jgi:hypothetical protein
MVTTTIPGGYVVEASIPWTTLGITPSAGTVMGLDLGLDVDHNGGSCRDGQLIWNGQADDYANASSYAQLTLTAACPTPIATPPAPTGGQPYVSPNPTNGTTVQFVYTMAEAGTAHIKVWNAWGNLAATISDPKGPGLQSSVLNVTSFAPGHYFFRIELDYNSGKKDVFGTQVLAVNILLASVCAAQTVLPNAGLVTPLSQLGASARADALGGALVGLADDPSALFFNPAGLSQLSDISLSINHNSYLATSFEETLLFGLPLGQMGGFAGALQYVSWGGLDERDAYGVSQGTFADSDVAFSVGWGMAVTPGFSAGVALHGVQQKIVDTLYTGLSGDLGVLWVPIPDLHVGLSYTGLGTDLGGFTPAQDLRLGLSSFVKLGKGVSLRPLLEGDWQPNGVSRVLGGLEGIIERDFFVRLGGQLPFSDNQVGGLTGFTAGAGFRVDQVRLDYAFVPNGDLGTSHRVSVGYEFPNPTPIPPKPVTVVAPVTVIAPPVTVVATPVATPMPAATTPKSKVEVQFELPGENLPAKADTQAASMIGPYEKAAQANPGDSKAWRNLGVAYLKAGQTALGVQCLEQSLRLNPADTALKKWLDDYKAKHSTNPYNP